MPNVLLKKKKSRRHRGVETLKQVVLSEQVGTLTRVFFLAARGEIIKKMTEIIR